MDKRSASTIRLADGARSAEATQIWNCCRQRPRRPVPPDVC
ncbi:hypothetical protein [uncultured Lamprocystis sp.]|nr:hypothetical protein [uncultured Lamprocystis sp.]